MPPLVLPAPCPVSDGDTLSPCPHAPGAAASPISAGDHRTPSPGMWLLPLGRDTGMSPGRGIFSNPSLLGWRGASQGSQLGTSWGAGSWFGDNKTGPSRDMATGCMAGDRQVTPLPLQGS